MQQETIKFIQHRKFYQQIRRRLVTMLLPH